MRRLWSDYRNGRMWVLLTLGAVIALGSCNVDSGNGYVAVIDPTHTADVSVSYSTSNPGIGAGFGSHCIAADRQDGWLYIGNEC